MTQQDIITTIAALMAHHDSTTLLNALAEWHLAASQHTRSPEAKRKLHYNALIIENAANSVWPSTLTGIAADTAQQQPLN